MEFFKIKKDIPFMRHALIFNVISALTFVAAVFFLVTKGLHFSVEFTGGTMMELQYPHAADQEKIRRNLETLGYEQPEVTSFGTAQDVMLRLPMHQGGSPAPTVRPTVFNAPVRGRERRAEAGRHRHAEGRARRQDRPASNAGRRRSGQPAARSNSSARRWATNWRRTA